MDRRPSLIVIQGAPGVGKTTLAGRLLDRLAAPLVSKDALKEKLSESYEVTTVADSVLLGKVAIAAMYAAVTEYLVNGGSCIIESAFVSKYANDDIEKLLVKTDARAVQVYCFVAEEERIRRFKERSVLGDRHMVHFDEQRTDSDDVSEKYGPLNLRDTIRIDTAKPVDMNVLVEGIRHYIPEVS